MSSCDMVKAQSGRGMVHFLEAFLSAKYTIFWIDLSSGKTPLFLIIFLIWRFADSMAFVV